VSDVEALRQEIAEALVAADFWHPDPTMPDSDFWGHYADDLLPVVTAWAEQEARARAAEELRAAADTDERGAWATWRAILRERAAALADDGRA